MLLLVSWEVHEVLESQCLHHVCSLWQELLYFSKGLSRDDEILQRINISRMPSSCFFVTAPSSLFSLGLSTSWCFSARLLLLVSVLPSLILSSLDNFKKIYRFQQNFSTLTILSSKECLGRCFWAGRCCGDDIRNQDSNTKLSTSPYYHHHCHRLPHQFMFLLRLWDGHWYTVPVFSTGLGDQWWI